MDDPENIFPQWYAVMCAPRAEFDANVNLRRLGYWTWLPFERVRKRKKLANRDQYEPYWTNEPYFPRYMFVRLPSKDFIASVNDTDGVSTVVYQGEEPLPIPLAVMDELMARADVEGLVSVEDRTARKRFMPGQQVKFVDESPFRYFIATVDIDKGPNVRVWLDVLGKQMSVPVPPSSIAAAG